MKIKIKYIIKSTTIYSIWFQLNKKMLKNYIFRKHHTHAPLKI